MLPAPPPLMGIGMPQLFHHVQLGNPVGLISAAGGGSVSNAEPFRGLLQGGAAPALFASMPLGSLPAHAGLQIGPPVDISNPTTSDDASPQNSAGGATGSVLSAPVSAASPPDAAAPSSNPQSFNGYSLAAGMGGKPPLPPAHPMALHAMAMMQGLPSSGAPLGSSPSGPSLGSSPAAGQR